jgi:glutamate-1-semialdehyde 2,1-aminomutase
MALAVAKAFTKRSKILVFTGAYHGGVLTFAGGNSPVNVPHDYVFGRYNDSAEAKRLIDLHAGGLAAVLVEPMLGAGGCIPGEPEFLRTLRQATEAVGALLIFDEVMTSRLSPGGRQQLLDLRPDLTTLGKYIGGGMSFGAFGGRADIMAMFDPRRADALPHAGTFNNNVLSMSAGIAGLTKIFTPEAAIGLNARGDALRERLNALCRDHQAPLQFTGLGSLMNAQATGREIRRPEDLATAEPRLKDLLFFDLVESGIYIARRGFTTLTLPIGQAETDRFVDAVGVFLSRRRSCFPVGR